MSFSVARIELMMMYYIFIKLFWNGNYLVAFVFCAWNSKRRRNKTQIVYNMNEDPIGHN